jgi:hypothetical protein
MGNTTPLIAAVDRSDFNKVRLLLADPTTDCEKFNCVGKTAVYVAARRGSVEILRLLLDNPNHRPELNRYTSNGLTPLHIAAAYCHLSCIEALLEAGADPRARTGPQVIPFRLPAAVVGFYASRGQNSNKEHIRAVLERAAIVAAQPVALPAPVSAPCRRTARQVAQVKPPGTSTEAPHYDSPPSAQGQSYYAPPQQMAASGAVAQSNSYGSYASLIQDPDVRPPAYSA